MRGSRSSRKRVCAATLAAAIAGAVIHPLVLDVDDETLRAELLRQLQHLLPRR